MADPTDTTAAATVSVHLQLNEKNDDTTVKEAVPLTKPPKRTTIQVLTFVDPTYELSWMAIGTSKRKFRAFLTFAKAIETPSSIANSAIQSQTISMPDGSESSSAVDENKTEKDTTIWLSREESLELKKKMRDSWKERRLLTTDTSWVKERKTGDSSDNNTAAAANITRGSFEDKLWFQVERFEEILLDEKEATPEQSLLTWLSENYGERETLTVQADQFRELTADMQLKVLQHFLDWFRFVFPYYYDRCLHCGKSMKDDRAKGEVQDEKKDDDDDDDGGNYLGQAQPSKDELKTGKASRVEMFQCHKCKLVYAFPRFNAAWSIVQTKRGRCGEYSILLYRMFRALGHADTCRYVVDWADHVWVELRRKSSPESLRGVASKYEWIHLDPCEAAVDNPSLYQSWGKKATFLIALFAPSFEKGGDSPTTTNVPFIEDVTSKYTSDSLDVIGERRRAGGESEDSVRQAITRCDHLLETKLAKFTDRN